jgi:hypothetical protein
LLNNLHDVPAVDPADVLSAMRRRLQDDFSCTVFAAALTEYGSRRARVLAREHHLFDEDEA